MASSGIPGTVGLRRSKVTKHWVITAGWVSLRIAPRTFWVALALLLLLSTVSAIALMHGTMSLSASEVIAAVWGDGERGVVRTVQGRRLPRLITAILVGGALGISGAMIQTVSRNPLGSPDIIGFTSGAATGAVIWISVFGVSVLPTALAAVAGGVLTASVVYLVARRDGVSGGIRLVLVGIGVGAITTAVTTVFVVRADHDRAANAQQWLAGTLIARGWTHATSMLVAVAILIVPVWIVSRRLSFLEMGDDLAAGVGVAVERTRFLAVALAVLLLSVSVATTGPIAFVSLAAPQIARRLTRSAGVQVGTAFLVGACLLLLADLLSQAVDIGLRTPVGTVTALLGGLYLIWLLARRA